MGTGRPNEDKIPSFVQKNPEYKMNFGMKYLKWGENMTTGITTSLTTITN